MLRYGRVTSASILYGKEMPILLTFLLRASSMPFTLAAISAKIGVTCVPSATADAGEVLKLKKAPENPSAAAAAAPTHIFVWKGGFVVKAFTVSTIVRFVRKCAAPPLRTPRAEAGERRNMRSKLACAELN